MDYYWNERTDPAYNLALEEVMTAQADAPFAMLWRNRPAVIIGRNQNACREFDAAYAREHGIAVVRRAPESSPKASPIGGKLSRRSRD